MPVLSANQVTLAEVLQVKGSPLNEEEIWAVLSQASKAIEKILAKGDGKKFRQPLFTVSPESLILSNHGDIAIMTPVLRDQTKQVTYTPPELSIHNVSPSDGAIEKMYVYSLGMTLYFAAEYLSIPNPSKLANLSVSLSKLLLSMCEEVARTRYSLRQVLAACGSQYGQRFYYTVIKSLVVLVLGNNTPQHPSRQLNSMYPSSLKLPAPHFGNHISYSHRTAKLMTGSNNHTMTSADDQPDYQSQNRYMTNIPHTLDRYRKYLEKARHQKTLVSPVIPDHSIKLSCNSYGNMPAMSSQLMSTASHQPGYDRTRLLDANKRGSVEDILNHTNTRHRFNVGLKEAMTADHCSDSSSDTSSFSDPLKSTLSSARSSSAASLMEGSYAPSYSLDNLRSDMWGSMPSLRDNAGSRPTKEWHRLSTGDLTSFSQFTNNSDSRYIDKKQQRCDNFGHKKYQSEQNLFSPGTIDKERRKKNIPKSKLRFLGPEFLQVSKDPNQSFVDITPETRSSAHHHVTVVMLNTQRLQIAVESSAKVEDLYTQVLKYLGITEKIYFGLCRIEDDERLFLDFDSKLSKYAPVGWKEKSKKLSGRFVLYFRVKFYLENLALIRHQVTCHQLYLQLRNDVIKENMYNNTELVVQLGAIALQAEYGDYSKAKFGESYFQLEHYVTQSVILTTRKKHIFQRLRALHKLQYGLSVEDAEKKFIEYSQKSPDYGLLLYRSQLKNKEKQEIYLGVSVRGVTVFELKHNKRKPFERHSWSAIKKVAFKRKKFYIEFPMSEHQKNKLTFLSPSYKRSKYFLHLCTSFHRFQAKMKSRLSIMYDALPRDVKQSDQPKEVNPNNIDKQNEISSETSDVDDDNSKASCFESDLTDDVVRGKNLHTLSSLPYVLNSSPSSLLNHALSSQDEARRTAEIIMSPDRRVVLINLKKDSRGSLGLTVVGGEDTQRLHYGIFIKKITSGSVAEQDGRLKTGDRILAVNGQSLEYVSHNDAVKALKNSPVDVELLVSQSKTAYNNIDMRVLRSPAASHLSLKDNRMSPYLASLKDNHDIIDQSNAEKSISQVNRNLEHDYLSNTTNPLYINDSQAFHPTSRASLVNSTTVAQWTCLRSEAGTPVIENNGVLIRSSSNPEYGEESQGSFKTSVKKITRSSSTSNSYRKNLSRQSTNKRRRNSSRKNVENNKIKQSKLGLQSESESDLETAPIEIKMNNLEHKTHQEEKKTNYFVVKLKKISGSLGLNVTGGINTNAVDGGIFVKSLYPNGAADLDGRIQVGHRILSVNGVSLQGVTHKQAVETLKRSPFHTALVLQNSPAEEISQTYNVSNDNMEPEMFKVVLMKGIGGLGMSLVGGIDCAEEYGEKIRIKAMFPGQPAENSGKLRVGDIIMAANDVSMIGKTRRDAINVLRDQPSRVVLSVKRDPASIPSGLLRRGSFTENLDPNEVLSAMSSKLQRNDSLHSTVCEEEPGTKKDLDQIENREIKMSHDSGDVNDEFLVNHGHIDESDEDILMDKKRINVYTNGWSNQNTSTNDLSLDNLSLQNDGNVSLMSKIDSRVSISSEKVPPVLSSVNSNPSMSEKEITAEEVITKNKVFLEAQHHSGVKNSASREEEIILKTRERLAPAEKVLDVVLHRGPNGLGFTLTGGADTVGGCFVREIIGDPARSDGRLRPKDEIVMVNGQDITNKKHLEAVNALRATRNEVHLVIRRRPDKIKSKTRDGLDVRTISLIRTTRGDIGLTLDQDNEGHIHVFEVIPDEPAAKDGGLKQGDIILEINGKRVDGTDLKFAVECLERARPVVTLVIHQFQRETESKYILLSPTESDREVLHETSSVENSNIYDLDTGEQLDSDNSDCLLSNVIPSEHVTADDSIETQDVDEEGSIGDVLELQEPREGATSLLPKMRENELEKHNEIDEDEEGSIKGVLELHEPRKGVTSSHSKMCENELEKHNEIDEDDCLMKEEQVFTTLKKGPRGLGFSLFADQTIYGTPGLFIRNIQDNSVVAEDGKIRVGDQLLKVNDDDVETLDHGDVITLLRSLSGVVTLHLLRLKPDEDKSTLPSEGKKQATNLSENIGVLNTMNTYSDQIEENVITETKDDDSTPSGNDVSNTQENWPQPPSSFEIESMNMAREDREDDFARTSDDEATSVAFSGDEFLDELENVHYTASLLDAESARNNVWSKRVEIEGTADEGRTSGSFIPPSDGTLKQREEPLSPITPELFPESSVARSSAQETFADTPPSRSPPLEEDLSSIRSRKVYMRDTSQENRTLRERFARVVEEENIHSSEFLLRPLINLESNSSKHTRPLLQVLGTSELYTGKSQLEIIRKLQDDISSGKAAEKFQALRDIKPTDNCPSGKRALNKEKNRYRNVLPYEKTRVILSGDDQLDYINANFIDISIGSETFHYIATQGPLPITTSDFWRMVWEQRCQVIAMITLDMECGKVKCHRYWPQSSELPVKVSPSLQVFLKSEESESTYCIRRTMTIKDIDEDKSLDIVHLNFNSWPDHGVPKSAYDLVEFVKQCHSYASDGPRIVHCSAGIGRTGTFLTIDTCMKHIERGHEFDIFDIVCKLREQRSGMIQTKDQFLFCYQACVEMLTSLENEKE